MFGRAREHVKVELRSNLTFMRDLSYIAFIFPKMFLPVLKHEEGGLVPRFRDLDDP